MFKQIDLQTKIISVNYGKIIVIEAKKHNSITHIETLIWVWMGVSEKSVLNDMFEQAF